METMGTHRPLSSSFLGLPYRILNMNHKKELLRGLWVETQIIEAFPRSSASYVQIKGSWDLVRKVIVYIYTYIHTLIGVISNYKYSYLVYNPSY